MILNQIDCILNTTKKLIVYDIIRDVTRAILSAADDRAVVVRATWEATAVSVGIISEINKITNEWIIKIIIGYSDFRYT